MKTLMFDIEVYPNYALFGLLDIDSRKVKSFELRGKKAKLSDKQRKKLVKLLTKNTVVGFNSLGYDEPITAVAIKGGTVTDLFNETVAIIVNGERKWNFYRRIGAEPFIKDHIDIMDVAKGSASLKEYGARIGVKKLQDLPYESETKLTEEQMNEVLSYNINDLELTEALYKFLNSDLELRRSLSNQYNENFMSMGAAKIADLILAKECGFTGKAPSAPKYVRYKAPEYLKFKDKQLKSLLERIKDYKFEVNEHSSVVLPEFLTEKFEFNGLMYQFGIGGLHASVSSTTIKPEKDETILDIDYKSLYPSLIIKNNFSPKHLGKAFGNTYQKMFDKRNNELKPKMKLYEKGSPEYKDLDNQQNGMKLILNSSFGKTGEKYAKIFDLNTMLNTTLTGQLTLMMVVEKLYRKGFNVFYANTDGISLLVSKKDVNKVKQITADFDAITGLEMEYDEFKACHIRDVNNFVNIPADGSLPKRKGAFAKVPQIDKNTHVPVVFNAVAQYLHDGTKIDKFIKDCENVADFCSSRKVTGGAMYANNIPEMYPDGWYESLQKWKRITKKMQDARAKIMAEWAQENGTILGKVVRWYYSTDGATIHYKKSGNKVPLSDGCKPMMNLTKKLPKDLDYNWYIDYAKRMLSDLGVEYV